MRTLLKSGLLVCFVFIDCVFTSACTDGLVVEPDMSAGFCPDHKAAMVLFLDRVYGIEDQNFLLHLLEVGFLPDLRAAASLDTVSVELLFLIFIVLVLHPTRLMVAGFCVKAQHLINRWRGRTLTSLDMNVAWACASVNRQLLASHQ